MEKWLEEMLSQDDDDAASGGETEESEHDGHIDLEANSDVEDISLDLPADEGLDVEEKLCGELGLVYTNNQVHMRATGEGLGEHKMVIVGVPFVRTICWKHKKCVLYLPSETMFAQKWLMGFKWLHSGRLLDGHAHMEEMQDIKKQFGIKPKTRQV